MSFSRDGAMRGEQLVWFNTAVLGFYILPLQSPREPLPHLTDSMTPVEEDPHA